MKNSNKYNNVQNMILSIILMINFLKMHNYYNSNYYQQQQHMTMHQQPHIPMPQPHIPMPQHLAYPMTSHFAQQPYNFYYPPITSNNYYNQTDYQHQLAEKNEQPPEFH